MPDLGDDAPAVLGEDKSEMVNEHVLVCSQANFDRCAERRQGINAEDLVLARLAFAGWGGSSTDIAAEALDGFDEQRAFVGMAHHANMSERTFARRFVEATGTTPHRWLTQSRVRRAQDLLETTTLSIERIAGEAGLGSAANLRHHFTREVRTTPTRYRSAFGADN